MKTAASEKLFRLNLTGFVLYNLSLLLLRVILTLFWLLVR